ncbi:MAG: PrsW family glutamic-type intramembrane protease [Acidimicrobiales bacterium]
MNSLTVSHAGQRTVLQAGQVAVFGRGADGPIVVDDPRVSREQLRLTWGLSGWLLESVGKSPVFLGGQQVAQFYLVQAVEVRLAAPDGPAVLFEPEVVSDAQATRDVGSDLSNPVATGGLTPAGVPAIVPATPAGINHNRLSHDEMRTALGILVPFRSWLSDPSMRQWYRVFVVIYGLSPIALLALVASSLVNIGDPGSLSFAVSIFMAPLWAIIFWYLIRPGKLGKQELILAGIIILIESFWVNAVTININDSLSPNNSHNLLQWILAPGYNEEFSKAIPVALVAMFMLYARNIKLDVRMWMFFGSLAGLTFGVWEANIYVTEAFQRSNLGYITDVGGVLHIFFRMVDDGFTHALWAGVAAVFIGLGVNYKKHRYFLWIVGLSIPALLHAANDWSTTGVFGNSNLWPLFGIQAFSAFLFLGYTVSAAAIERKVRHTAMFRGSSIYQDQSALDDPQGTPPAPA